MPASGRGGAPVTRVRATCAFAVGTLFFGYAFVQRVAPSVMTAELMRDFAVGAAALGTLSAWYFYAYAGIQLPVGLLLDRFGPRVLLSSAMAFCALASLGFVGSQTLFGASIFRGVIGGAVAFGFLGTLTIAVYWFPPRRFAMLAGIVQTVGMLGAMLGQAPLRYAVEQLGWRSTMVGLGVLAIVLATSLFLVVPGRPNANPVDTGRRAGPLSGLKSVIANPQSWACAGIGFGMSSAMLAFAGLWAVPWLVTVFGFPTTTAAGVASSLFLGWAAGAPVMGWLSDHIGRRKPVLLIGAASNLAVLSLVLFAGVESSVGLAILFLLLGVCGSSMTAIYGSIRELNPSRFGATAMALANMCVVGAGAVMQPLIGSALDLGWDGKLVDGARIYSATNYLQAFSLLVGAGVLALVCAVSLRESYCRPANG